MNIEDRIDRLESLDEIRQLAAKYSVTLDMRDLDMHVNLFVPDVRVVEEASGRQALKSGLMRHLEINLLEPLITLETILLILKALTQPSAWCIQKTNMKQVMSGSS